MIHSCLLLAFQEKEVHELKYWKSYVSVQLDILVKDNSFLRSESGLPLLVLNICSMFYVQSFLHLVVNGFLFSFRFSS